MFLPILQGLPPSTDIKSVVAEPEIVQRGEPHCFFRDWWMPHLYTLYCGLTKRHAPCAAKTGDLHVSVTPEVTGQTRHRGSRGIPLVPQVNPAPAFALLGALNAGCSQSGQLGAWGRLLCT